MAKRTRISSTYQGLRDRVIGILADGKERAKQAVEREKIVTYWEVGREIHVHLLEEEDRASYGKTVIGRLAEDTGLSNQRLYEILNFYRVTKISRLTGKLRWTHYTRLISVENKEERDFYERRASEEGWTVEELRDKIKSKAFKKQDSRTKRLPLRKKTEIRVRRGLLNHYRIGTLIKGGKTHRYLDVGFGTHQRRLVGTAWRKAGETVEVTTDARGRVTVRKSDVPKGQLFTYQAWLQRVIDGDTIVTALAVPNEDAALQTLRFRGIDTPELPSSKGQRAKRFVQEALGKVDFFVVKTSRPDKYRRYLADIFYMPGESDPHVVAREGRFLNRELVEAGLAVIV